MSDPLRDIEYDRQQAERLRAEERGEENPATRKDYDRLASDYDAEADELESEINQE